MISINQPLFIGRVDIRLNVTVPEDTELLEQLQEGCIWRQARGVASLALEAEEVTGPLEKVYFSLSPSVPPSLSLSLEFEWDIYAP